MIGRFRNQETEGVEQPRGFDDFDLRLGDIMRGERATLGKSLLDVQRELKIKATYIAAIENADPEAFETPGFIAGYVRSYARYLGLDPEWAYGAFCAESGFATAHGMSDAASAAKRVEPSPREGRVPDPFGERGLGLAPRRESILSGIEPAAIGSLVVLAALVGVIGYGGFAVLNEIQKVQVVPIDAAPEVVADLDPLDSARPVAPEGADDAGVEALAAAEGFDRLYRPQALDVPVLTPRDAPISTIDPRTTTALDATVVARRFAAAEAAAASRAAAETQVDLAAFGPVAPADGAASFDVPLPPEMADGDVPRVVADVAPEVVLFAVRPSWVRVRSADGTTLYEKVMNEGDTFTIPANEDPATLRTGESGAIYFSVNGTAYGPAGAPGQVTGGLSLAAANLTDAYSVADLEGDAAAARVFAELTAAPAETPGTDDTPPADE